VRELPAPEPQGVRSCRRGLCRSLLRRRLARLRTAGGSGTDRKVPAHAPNPRAPGVWCSRGRRLVAPAHAVHGGDRGNAATESAPPLVIASPPRPKRGCLDGKQRRCCGELLKMVPPAKGANQNIRDGAVPKDTRKSAATVGYTRLIPPSPPAVLHERLECRAGVTRAAPRALRAQVAGGFIKCCVPVNRGRRTHGASTSPTHSTATSRSPSQTS